MPAMLAARPTKMSFEEYLVWEAEQEEKWELVDGVPVLRSERWSHDPVTGMAGATFAHNRIVFNLLRHLGNRLAGGPCVPLPSDLKVRAKTGNARYPDVVVECGRPENGDLLAKQPTVLFEVQSPSNRRGRQMRLIADYQSMDTVQHVVFIEQHCVDVTIWNRTEGPWIVNEYEALTDVLPLPAIGTEIGLSEIYEGLGLGPAEDA